MKALKIYRRFAAISLSMVLCSVGTAHAQSVTAAEYFFDVDPGPGQGTAIAIPSPAEAVQISVDVPPATIAILSDGVHWLVCRTMDDRGNWSQAFQRSFYKHDPVADPSAEIVAAEYYIDVDPGPGNGSTIPIAPQVEAATLVVDVPPATVAALDNGQHLLACRFLDSSGHWSTSYSRTFYKLDPAAVVQPTIQRIEYQWALNGTLVGNAIPVSPNTPTEIVSLQILASLAGLNDGETYRLVVTPYDTAGSAGMSVTSDEVLVQTSDSDGDGVPDLWEETFSFSPNDPSDMQVGVDADGDGLDNSSEFTNGTNPRSRDTDGDGITDPAEIGMAALGFDPTVASGDLVDSLYENAEGAGLYRREQLQAIALGKPLLERDDASKRFTLRLRLSKSLDLKLFEPFPFIEPETEVNPFGEVEFKFAPEDDAAFFSLELK